MVNQEAIRLAKLAVEADTSRRIPEAINFYEQAAALILSENPSEPDRAQAVSYRNRVVQLKQLLAAEQAQSMQATANLAQQGVQVAQTVNASAAAAGGATTLAAAAAVGGAVGLVVSGPLLAVAGAGAAAYAATRPDGIGEAARSTGQTAISTLHAANTFNQEHKLTERASNAVVAGASKAKEVNEKYNILGTISNAVTTGVQKAKEIEKQHQVSTKVGSVLSQGLDSVTKALGSGSSNNSTPGPNSGSNIDTSLPSVPK